MGTIWLKNSMFPIPYNFLRLEDSRKAKGIVFKCGRLVKELLVDSNNIVA